MFDGGHAEDKPLSFSFDSRAELATLIGGLLFLSVVNQTALLLPAGVNVAVAARLLEHEMQGKTFVTMICDSALKYLSTDLWSESTADFG
ncbi:MAG: hypothetical protein CBB70_02465 [Planctomycetaceae bacterium TMED10]|nr:MAG: hypothetical protein CBB70_02465 [Planctomycetaceae bacterium TMED10]